MKLVFCPDCHALFKDDVVVKYHNATLFVLQKVENAVGKYGRFQDKGFKNSSNFVSHTDQGRQRAAMRSDFQSGVHPNESFEGVQRRQHYWNKSTCSQPMFLRTFKAEPTVVSLHGLDGAQHNQISS
ncbi:hypothetical protein POM88_055027 [Heracleum sosnowskyi]|uniref:Uncharacterized protein n=1 Tax=Heracleum sosnowskyi TaxID=360622 RepID=A0AAD8GMM3_9APIA|nr:hypothetical protein POM88_055027 [Heracleum sosnowskyi]